MVLPCTAFFYSTAFNGSNRTMFNSGLEQLTLINLNLFIRIVLRLTVVLEPNDDSNLIDSSL